MMHSTAMSNMDYDAHYDMETLKRAKEIEANPSRLAKAKAHAEKMAAEYAELAGGHKDGAEASLMKGYRSVS